MDKKSLALFFVALAVVLSLVVYLIAQFLSYTAIFHHFYLSLRSEAILEKNNV